MNTPQMTLLDYFAAASIATAHTAAAEAYGPIWDCTCTAQMAYQMARAMLKQSLSLPPEREQTAREAARIACEAERDRCVGIVRSMLSKQPELQQAIIDQILLEV